MSTEPVTSSIENHSIEPESEKGDLNGREVEVQQHIANAKEHLKEYVLSPIEATAHIVTNPNPVGIMEAGKIIKKGHSHLIEGCKEYNTAVEIERAAKGQDKFGNPLNIEKETNESDSNPECDRENDRDS